MYRISLFILISIFLSNFYFKERLTINKIKKENIWLLKIVIYQFIFFPFLSTSNNFFSMDPTMGAFGWLNDSYSLFLVMWVNAPITGILANVGFFSSFKYFPIQIVTGVMLIEPFFAQLTGILLGQDEVPGVCTLAGLIIITGAFVITGLGATYKTQDQLKMKENYEQIDLELSIIDNTK